LFSSIITDLLNLFYKLFITFRVKFKRNSKDDFIEEQDKLTLMKKILIFLFGHHSKIPKYWSIFKDSYRMLKVILPLVKSNKLKFCFKIIKGHNYLKFQSNLNNKKEYFKNKYQFNYDDWFSGNMNVWEYYLENLKEIKYLEIGSFEGRSAVFVGELNNVKEVTCVDTFEGSDEHNNINFDLVYNNCSKNLKKLNISYNLIKNSSHNFFKINDNKFNVIYIDGSHFYNDVKKDFINSMNSLVEGGILICDDFFWFFYEKKEDNPIGAILECYENNKKNLEILFVNRQIIFKKIKAKLN